MSFAGSRTQDPEPRTSGFRFPVSGFRFPALDTRLSIPHQDPRSKIEVIARAELGQ